MEKTITLVTATFGSIDCKVNINPTYPNTIELGNKRLCFDEILPYHMDLREIDDFHIIIYDGVMPKVNIIIGPSTFRGNIDIPSAKHQEILAH